MSYIVAEIISGTVPAAYINVVCAHFAEMLLNLRHVYSTALQCV